MTRLPARFSRKSLLPERRGKKKTIFAVKLRAGDRMAEVWALTKLLGAFALGLGVMFAVQVAMCKHAHPKATVAECVKPTWHLRGKGK